MEFIHTTNEVKCTCGSTFSVRDLYHDLSRNLSYLNPEIKDSDRYICKNCSREYEVTLSISLDICLDDCSIREITQEYRDKNFNIIQPSFFEDLSPNEKVPLWDGDYRVNGMIYKVIDGEIAYILPDVVHPNQMDIFELIS